MTFAHFVNQLFRITGMVTLGGIALGIIVVLVVRTWWHFFGVDPDA